MKPLTLRIGVMSVLNAPHAADNLEEERCLTAKTGALLECDPDMKSIWRDIVGLFSNQRLLRQDIDLEWLVVVMQLEYAREDDFNKELFLALRKCLERYQLIYPLPTPEPEKPENCPIIFRYQWLKRKAGMANYAIGIARELPGEQQVGEERNAAAITSNSASSANSNGLASRCKMDHCTCLLKEEHDGTWTVAEVLSVLQLKISDERNFANITVQSERRRGEYVVPFALQSFPPVSQALSYTIAWVLPSHAKLGVLQSFLRWSIMIGKRGSCEPKHKKQKLDTSVPERTLAIAGKMHVPKECGEPFEYSITGYVRSEDNKVDLNGAIGKAIGHFLETIFFGLAAAKNWMLADQPVTPNLTSGRQVVVGRTLLHELQWRGSATLGKLLRDAEEANRWRINQGEMFTGKLKMSDVKAGIADDSNNTIIFDASNAELDVVVKVSSAAIHRHIVPADKTFLALKDILKRKEDKAQPVVSDVLFAVHKPSIGMITIMADLFKQGYRDLKPESIVADGVRRSELWDAFAKLVNAVLLPLAEIGVIHPDIRAGFDVTSNIVCKIEGHNQASMRLIDFESITNFRDWLPPKTNFKFIRSDRSWSVGTFVWWQCITVAYAWLEDQHQCDVEQNNIETVQKGEWWKPFRRFAKKRDLNAAHVMQVLTKVADEFRLQECGPVAMRCEVEEESETHAKRRKQSMAVRREQDDE